MSALLDLAARVEALDGPDREVDAEIMFDFYARPVGKRAEDCGPRAYLWPEDNPSWSFGIRFPGKKREWFKTYPDKETLLIERDGAFVLMNDLRIPKLTASLDAAMTLVPEGWYWMAGNRDRITPRAYVENGQLTFIGVGAHLNPDRLWFEVTAKTPALALTAACLRVRAALSEQS